MEQEKLEKIIKVGLAILFLMCLLPMPYGFYSLVRFLAMVGFTILAYYRYKEEAMEFAILYGGLALLFQPIIRVSLGRTMWNIVDVIVALGLIYSIYSNSNK